MSETDSVLVKQQQELLNSLVSNPTLLTLVGLVPGLQDQLLSQAGGVTVLAPSEEAFAKVPSIVINFLTDPANVDALKTVLEYHLIKSDSSLLALQSFGPSIQIERVLIPPSLERVVNNLINSVHDVNPVIPMGDNSLPTWMLAKKPNNNWS
jgi:uncharacterized surface protein with fasciclin (FAS1) repeats